MHFLVENTSQGKRNLTLDQNPVTSTNVSLILRKDMLSYEDLTPEEQEIHMDYFLSKIVPTKSFGNRLASVYTPLSFLGKRNNLSSIALLQDPFVLGANTKIKKDMVRELILVRSKQVLKLYLEKQHIYSTLQSKHINPDKSENMIAYKDRSIKFIAFQLAQYFFEIKQVFSDKLLNTLISNITARITIPLQLIYMIW